MLSKLAAQCDDYDTFGPETPLRFQEGPLPVVNTLNRLTSYEEPTSAAQSLQGPDILKHVPKLNLQTATSKRAQFFSRPLWYYRMKPNERRLMLAPSLKGEEGAVQVAQPVPVLKRKKLERQAKKKDPLGKMEWLNVSPRSAALMDVVKNDLPTLFEQVRRQSAATSNASSVVLVSPRNVSTSNIRTSLSPISPIPPFKPPVKAQKPTPKSTRKDLQKSGKARWR